jgi:hypothetical protein
MVSGFAQSDVLRDLDGPKIVALSKPFTGGQLSAALERALARVVN